jgi:hypothetical protein
MHKRWVNNRIFFRERKGISVSFIQFPALPSRKWKRLPHGQNAWRVKGPYFPFSCKCDVYILFVLSSVFSQIVVKAVLYIHTCGELTNFLDGKFAFQENSKSS